MAAEPHKEAPQLELSEPKRGDEEQAIAKPYMEDWVDAWTKTLEKENVHAEQPSKPKVKKK